MGTIRNKGVNPKVRFKHDASEKVKTVEVYQCGCVKIIKFRASCYKMLVWSPESICVSVISENLSDERIFDIINKMNEEVYELYKNYYEAEDGSLLTKEEFYEIAEYNLAIADEIYSKKGLYDKPSREYRSKVARMLAVQ